MKQCRGFAFIINALVAVLVFLVGWSCIVAYFHLEPNLCHDVLDYDKYTVIYGNDHYRLLKFEHPKRKK